MTESGDYISREETLKRLCKDVCNVSDCQCDEIRCLEWYVIHDAPAADVRPVVLFRDCSYADYSGMGNGTVWCNELEHAMQETDFCSRGKREES